MEVNGLISDLMNLYSLKDWFGEWLVCSRKRAYHDCSCRHQLGCSIFCKSSDLIGGIFGVYEE